MSVDKLCINFNENITNLIDIVLNLDPNNHDVLEIQSKFRIYRRSCHDDVIKEIGPAIWKYREQIVNNDDNFFLNLNLNIEQVGGININNIIIKLKDLYVDMNDDEKMFVWNNVRSLLVRYSKYIKITKDLI